MENQEFICIDKDVLLDIYLRLKHFYNTLENNYKICRRHLSAKECQETEEYISYILDDIYYIERRIKK